MDSDYEACSVCGGTGEDPNHNGAECSHCDGDGVAFCEWCDSELSDPEKPCPACREDARAIYESGLRGDMETELIPGGAEV